MTGMDPMVAYVAARSGGEISDGRVQGHPIYIWRTKKNLATLPGVKLKMQLDDRHDPIQWIRYNERKERSFSERKFS